MPGGWRSIGWFPVLLFTEHGTGADTGVKCFFHHMYGPAIDSCSDRIVRSDGKGLKRFHIRIYCRSVGCGLADIQRKFHSPDITFGWFTDSSGFPVMGVLQPCHSESHPEIFSGFHHQKNIFLWHNNNSAHFPFSAFIDKACCIAGQWSVEQSPFFRCHSFVCLLSVVEYCRKTTGDDTGIQLSLSESSCHNGWGYYIPTWGGDPSRDRRNRLGSLGCISGYQKLPSSKQYCYKKASGLSSVYFIITIIICRPHLVINLRFKQCFSFSSHQENTPFYLFLNETIDNHRFE